MKSKSNLKKQFRELSYLLYLATAVVLLLEIGLRIYNPFPQKMRGYKWELSTNTTYKLENISRSGLDKTIVNKRNSIGFRDVDPSSDIKNDLTAVTIGGSTTACTYLTEGKTWTDELGEHLGKKFNRIWINNAGIDGHSSFGNLNFLYYYLLRLPNPPKVAVFLIGANDVDRTDLAGVDSNIGSGALFCARNWFLIHSETAMLVQNLKSIFFPQNVFADRSCWDFSNFNSVRLSKEYMDSALRQQTNILNLYKQRLELIVKLCRQSGISPVFMTQPCIAGDSMQECIKPSVDFHEFMNHENAQLFWLKLRMYNEVTKRVALISGVPCIDLATKMPNDPVYFYDLIHFTNEGARKIAEIVDDGLTNFLAEKFSAYLKHREQQNPIESALLVTK